MNEEMQLAWLEISDMLGEPTREELDVFLRTWQRASQATRKALAEQPARPYRQLQDNGSKYFGESWDKAEQPAQRHWVGLTDEEIIDVLHPLVMADMPDEATDYEIARAIEAKLKEKNT